ncbi:MAG TPA: MerR family transcriptional regulator [Solirubrobacteraceae bacterium]|nr:MerR family transcriptional regulator [Solirubrobacteraceae bacterium]
MNDAMLQIGEVAEQAGLSLRTVRYYEETGLLKPAMRTDGGFRLYTAEHVDRLALIKRMKPLGFTVQQMRELLEARDTLSHEDTPDDVREAARERLGEFTALAAAASDKLREQLAGGDEFVRQLRRESRRPRISAVVD